MFLVDQAIGEHTQGFDHYLHWYKEIMLAVASDSFQFPCQVLPLSKCKSILLQGIIIKIVADWEELVTQDMILLFAQDTKKFCSNFSCFLPDSIPPGEAEAILAGERYLNFRDVDDILGYAKKHLACNLNPFRKGNFKDCCVTIDELLTVRNRIAHVSKKSRMRYDSKLSAIYGNKYPGFEEFLLWVPPERKKRIFEIYVDALKEFSKSVVQYLENVE